MKKAIIAILEDSVQVAIYKPGKKPVIHGLYQEKLDLSQPMAENWISALQTIWTEEKLPKKCRVTLSIHEENAVTKMLSLPEMPPKKLAETVHMELQSREDTEMLTDYLPMGKDAEGKQQLFCAACTHETMEGYVNGIEQLGLKMERVTVPLVALMNLVPALEEMRERNCIWLVFDGETVLSVLVENGTYRYATRSRIFSEQGTLDFGTEIGRNVSGTIQFHSTGQNREPVTDLYYAGCPDDIFEVCIPDLQNLGLKVSRLPDWPAVQNVPQQIRLSDWSYCVGLMRE